MGFDGATMQEEKPKNGFWERADIIGAQRVLDVWGTVKWHWKFGGQGVPTLDWIDLRQEEDVYIRIVKRGRYFLREQRHLGKQLVTWEDMVRVSKPGATPIDKLPVSFLLTLGVDAVLGEFENPPGLHALLLHRYPINGPAARPEGQRGYRLCRPPSVLALCGQLRGKYMEVRIDQILAQMERDFLDHMGRLRLTR